MDQAHSISETDSDDSGEWSVTTQQLTKDAEWLVKASEIESSSQFTNVSQLTRSSPPSNTSQPKSQPKRVCSSVRA